MSRLQQQEFCLEALEERRMLSAPPVPQKAAARKTAEPPAVYSKAVMKFLVSRGYLTQAQATRSKGVRRIVDGLVEIKTDAAAIGASDAGTASSLNLVFQGKISQAKRVVVADALSLPPEALKTNLSARGLVRFVSGLRTIGAEGKAQDPAQWKDVSRRGTEVVLGDDVRQVLGLPAQATKGKSVSQLLDGAARINLLGADPRSGQAWTGLGLLQKHKITVEQFSDNYSSGGDIGQQNQVGGKAASAVEAGANVPSGPQISPGSSSAGPKVAQGAAGSASSASSADQTGAPGVDPMIAAFAGITSNGTDTGHTADAVVVVHNNPDGTYTATTYVMGDDGQPMESGTETFSDPDGDGEYTGDKGGSAGHPSDGYYPATTDEDGHASFVYEDGKDGDQQGGSTGGEGGDSQGGGDDKNNSGNDSGGDGSNDGDSSGSSGSMPNPDGESFDPGAWQRFLLTTPMGAMELRSMARDLGLAGNGGQDGPMDGEDDDPIAGLMFSLAPIGVAPGVIAGGGAIDRFNDDVLALSLDITTLDTLKLRGGGASDPPQSTDTPSAGAPIVGHVAPHGGSVAAGLSAGALTGKLAGALASAAQNAGHG